MKHVSYKAKNIQWQKQHKLRAGEVQCSGNKHTEKKL